MLRCSRRAAVSGLALAFLPSAPGFAANCKVALLTSVPIALAGRTPLVTVLVDGKPARFVLDTGAERSVVSEAAVARLGLPRDKWVGTTMGGVGGLYRRPDAIAQSLSLGGVALVRNTLKRDTSFAVTPTLRGVKPDVADGLLGRDYLTAFDLDLDMVNQTLGLRSVSGCAGRFLPWKVPYVTVPVTMALKDAAIVPVDLDGRRLRAMLDTGSSSSLLAAPGMYKLGLSVAAVAGDPGDTVSGVGPRSVVMRRHRFKSLTVAGETEANPDVWVAPVHLTPIVDMLLGMDWLIGRRIWISYATKQIFVQQAASG